MLAQNITRPREQLRVLRAQMADAVEKLISAMDHIDGDPDLELTGDENEPSLATMDGRNHAIDFTGDTDDREVECDDEGNDSDTELNGDEGDFSGADDDGPSYFYQRQNDRHATRVTDIRDFITDGRGNAFFTLDGVPMQGGPLR
ncbi:hypothetical protein [Asticcacaulis benevestitus]|uniref:Uncharacterized protein n=1 Tax=Asticcacaulis benevestitus DSM 16100 = ATCC BAA-896 TaxID=1121022 RepID=V4NT86_9CAUL|nr:hypothetical protein [Asticcacaulis benevestitus]ESQ79126.1 hypothetical protein ABENE_22860 [Asticcacaulis benevestitus DSM 16100 = ATCC BAA-896]